MHCLQILCSLYAKTISALSRLPEEATYRKNTERIVQQRLNIVQEVGQHTVCPVDVLSTVYNQSCEMWAHSILVLKRIAIITIRIVVNKTAEYSIIL